MATTPFSPILFCSPAATASHPPFLSSWIISILPGVPSVVVTSSPSDTPSPCNPPTLPDQLSLLPLPLPQLLLLVSIFQHSSSPSPLLILFHLASKNNAQDEPTICRTRSKNRTIRTRTAGGLTRSTGRVKPNGTIKCSDSKKNPPAPMSPPAPQQPLTAPVKLRTVIDQNPIPLQRDGNDSASSASTSPESEDKILLGDSAPLSGYASISPSVAALARMYDFPPLPPRAPLLEEEEEEMSSFPEPSNDYQSGVMMAAYRIKTALCPEPAPKRSSHPFNQAPSHNQKPIPGWTDGSDAWRSSVYSLSTVETAMKQASGVQDRPCIQIVRGLPALLYRRLLYTQRASYTDSISLFCHFRLDLKAHFGGEIEHAGGRVFQIPSDLRSSLGFMHVGLMPGTQHPQTGPSLSSCRSGLGSTRSRMQSPLSRKGSELSEDSISQSQENEAGSLPTPKRPGIETRPWSYGNVLTYPLMPMPNKEIKFERRVVNGKTKIIEVEVEVQPQMKRLFLFPGKEVRQ
ncbi:hypothetical protein EW146_g1255 [Bondarzewia mesenterica]|uniref:Uncharacterized protein n=1 Tax=Bondarzewia mesenterica TaxID=1095465 RepID=A0A4S4M6Q7_9AGAM|nr:hypothetical protein EW146_g1255 [Bondarzewia mesenterica]